MCRVVANVSDVNHFVNTENDAEKETSASRVLLTQLELRKYCLVVTNIQLL